MVHVPLGKGPEFLISGTNPQHPGLTMSASPCPQDWAMRKKVIVADAAASMFMLFKKHGICFAGDEMGDGLAKIFCVKAIGYMASIALARPIEVVTAEYMFEVLGHDNDFKRVHGERFPRELTDDGWRSSFTALSDYIEGWID